MSFDIGGARSEGYTDSQIADHLAGLHGYDVGGARTEGYTDAQIAEHLASKSTTLAKAKNVAEAAFTPAKSVADQAAGTSSAPLPDSIQADPTRIVTTTADRATDLAVNKVIAERGIGKPVEIDGMAETSRFLGGDINESPQARIDKLSAESAEGMARNTATPEQQAIYDRANAAARDQFALDKSPVPRGIQRNSGGTIEAPVEALAAARRRDAPATSVTSDVAEVGKQLAAGGIDLAGMAGKAGQAMSGGKVGGDLEQWAEDKSKGWEPELEGRGGIGSAFVRGARSVVPSLAAAAPYLLAGGVGVPTKIAMALGDTGTIALFGGSAYTDTKRKIEKQNPFGENAWQAGVLSATSQGGLEVVQNRFTLGLLGAGKGVTREAMNAMVGNAVDKSVFKPFAVAYGKAMVGEPGTEAIQDTATELTERAYGARPTDLWEMAKDSITATMGMVTLTAPFGLVGHYRNAKQAAAIDEILSNPLHPVEARQSVVNMLYRQGVVMKAPDAAIWLAGAKTDIDNNRPIRRDAGGNADPAQADAALGAAVHGAISAEAVLGTPEPVIPYPDAAPGSLSSAANVAAKHGLTPQNASILPVAQPAGQPAPTPAEQAAPPTQDVSRENAGIAGHPSEVVLPDNTALPAQWEVVDADQVTATLKEGKNQPRDRSRATSNVQVQGIANLPDYRRLSDSPVMDVGAPTLALDGAIVGGNGRFEGVSRAYDQGTAAEYRARLEADAAAKGIDPATFAGMKKPVLVRRITQPFDTRSLAVASNSGGSLQYSALELAKIDGERMTTLGDIEVNDTGDIEMTVANMQNVRRALAGYGAAELGSMSDKDGMLSQEGIRRIKNAMLYRAYGNSPTLSRLVETTDNEMRSVSGALVRAAGAVSSVRADMAAGAVPANTDIAADLVVAVELMGKIKAAGGTVQQYLAQHGLFKGEYTEAAATILRFLSENIRSQKRMAEFIRSYYDALASEDTMSGSMFEELAPPTKQERLSHATRQAEAETAGQPAGSADSQDQQQPKSAQGTTESGREGQQAVTGDGTQAAPIKVETTEHLRLAEQNVNTSPTDAQKEAGVYKMAHIQWNGLDITIENPKGSERSGKDSDGEAWSVTMPASYGYLKRTEGSDGEHIDVYLGEDHQSANVYVVDQINPDNKAYDEHKVMLGFASKQEAERTYKAGFSDGKGAARMGAITQMSLDEFKAWIKTEDTTKPVGDVSIKASTAVAKIPAPTGGLTVEFGGAKYPVESLEDASKKWIAFRDESNAGVSEIGNGVPIFDGSGKQIAHISYNGRVWSDFDGLAATQSTSHKGAVLSSYTANDVANRERTQQEAERNRITEENLAKANQAAKDAADVAARTKARTDNADNFQFGESSKDAAKPMGGLFDQDAKAKADADIEAALFDLGAIMRDVAGVQRLLPEDRPKIMAVLVRLFDAAFRKGYYDIKDAAKYVRKLLSENESVKALLNHITTGMMNDAAQQAADNMPAGFFDNQGLFAQAAPKTKAEASPVETKSNVITISDIPKSLKITLEKVVDGKTMRKQVNARKAMLAANQRVEKLEALKRCLS